MLRSQSTLVDEVSRRIHLSAETLAVLNSVDRKTFVDSPEEDQAYEDTPLRLHGSGYNPVTISAPHMHAYAIELLKAKLVSGNKVLDVGSGSGYLTVCFGVLVDVLNNSSATVIGMEIDRVLVESSKAKVKRYNPRLAEAPNFRILYGNASTELWDVKFDAIHVGAASRQIPVHMLEALNNGGLMMVPVGAASAGWQELAMVERRDFVPGQPEADADADADADAEDAKWTSFVNCVREQEKLVRIENKKSGDLTWPRSDLPCGMIFASSMPRSIFVLKSLFPVTFVPLIE